ncbi:unnamed protein product [Caenorhabditis auriculariae]|uniref:Gamma interferon inducible lysosomal thiol reductase n=1 Tax=Caenorhabditis auriculariae TaxID=2777116 RepID=A0A8S1H6K3_9PELO|nr:unnamed protein product [Caenorhabditis auriculariae]
MEEGRKFESHPHYKCATMIRVAVFLTFAAIGTVASDSPLLEAYRRMFGVADVADPPVMLEVFGESLCPDTTRFLKEHLLPTAKALEGTGSLILKYHPSGVQSECYLENGLYRCECQHGDRECLLNQLQSCVISALEIPQLYLPVVVCIQGRSSFRSAISECIENAEPRPELDSSFMASCAKSQLGVKLLVQQNNERKRIAPNLDWVPWIIIDGRREPEAEYDLRTALCSKRAISATPFCQH